MITQPNVRLTPEDTQYRIYLANDLGLDSSPMLYLEWEKGRNEYLIGDLILARQGDHFLLSIKSCRRKTVIASAKVLDNGSVGIYLNQCFSNMANKAELVLSLRDAVTRYLYC
ncbi:hypothetical protein MORTIMER_197 [Erwinia phage vB_EamM_Mortimer]|jgi:hypothetical protein|uniref:Uncharacterized protein n=2 Tax=Agricanvirus TaxID=1984776 RepID=A0A173GDE9_9CAUD|nr:hypothetical protein FDH99_gp195 [Erwinia phage vB_EamM_Simmy50]ANH51657.1 hypothetical protein SIMMY50_195 [Erwinia phage vB_EamM_Simmy50]AUG86946.1 hypothetical protein MORTIMER_197 [Erwinia phage vB_EamM_Mortimer]